MRFFRIGAVLALGLSLSFPTSSAFAGPVAMQSVERPANNIVEIKHRKKRYRDAHRHERRHRDYRKKDYYGRNLGGRWRTESNGQRIWIPGTGR